MEVRKGLEVQSAILAAQRRTEKDLETIRKVTRAMRENMYDLDMFIRLDVEFHLGIAAASHNTVMVSLVESIRDALRSTIIAGLQSRGPSLQVENIQRTHEALFQALVDGNVQAAMGMMIQHFDEAIIAMTNPISNERD
jgi:GntR family transcriptional regulator, transcriptional repressor for pyruvate dehydrogenase complex